MLEWDPLPPKPPKKVKPHKGHSGRPAGAPLWAAVGIAGLPLATLAGVATWLLHGYGVI